MESQKHLICCGQRFVDFNCYVALSSNLSTCFGLQEYSASLRKNSSFYIFLAHSITFLLLQGKRLVFVTNNSTKSRKQYGKKFESLGLSVNEVSSRLDGSTFCEFVFLIHDTLLSGGNFCIIFCCCSIPQIN